MYETITQNMFSQLSLGAITLSGAGESIRTLGDRMCGYAFLPAAGLLRLEDEEWNLQAGIGLEPPAFTEAD